MLDAVRRFASSIFSPKKRPSDAELSARPVRPRRSGRSAVEIETELGRLRRKLEEVEGSLQREQTFSRKSGARTNEALVGALSRRAESIRHSMKKLAGELGTIEASGRASERRSLARSGTLATIKSRVEAKGTDRSLAQAAGVALKKGRFANASERAVFEKIASDLTDGGTELQLHALERLGELKATAAFPIFSAGARHQNEDVRVAAVRGALAMRDPVTRPILVGALADRSHRVRVWAVRGLYGLDDPALGELLCGQLRDQHPAVRRTAATYLSWKRIPGSEKHLARRMHDDSPEVRVAVASALGQCGSDASVFKLILALKDESPQVREAAAGALERIIGVAPEFTLDGEEEQRAEQIADLKNWWREQRPKRLIGTAEAPQEEEGSLDEDEESGLAEETPLESQGEQEAGLDAEPDLGGDLDDVGGDFVAADESEEL